MKPRFEVLGKGEKYRRSKGCTMGTHMSVQVSGEDLTPYRQASKAIWSLLQKFGPVQRGGMDEAFVDITAEVRSQISANFTGVGSLIQQTMFQDSDNSLEGENAWEVFCR